LSLHPECFAQVNNGHKTEMRRKIMPLILYFISLEFSLSFSYFLKRIVPHV
jgi:hypothetical protein